MKTRNWILVILAIAFTTNVFATKTPKMNIIALDDSKALVAVQQSEPAKSEFSIISENGQTVYYKETKKQDSQFKAVFDLSALEDGEYTVRYKTGAALVKRNVAISSGEIEIKSMKTQFDPVFALYGNVLKVSYLNYEQEKLKLLIYDDGELIYNSSLGNEFTFQRGFDLSNLDEGNYDISLASNDEEYWFSVTK